MPSAPYDEVAWFHALRRAGFRVIFTPWEPVPPTLPAPPVGGRRG